MQIPHLSYGWMNIGRHHQFRLAQSYLMKTPDFQIRYNKRMINVKLSRKSIEVILHDAIQRDITTARRAALLQILWNERYLTRTQLIARVEYRLGRNCFGISAWEDTFYRDMRVVKQAFQADGHLLEYNRSKERLGYCLHGQPALSPEFKRLVSASAAEADQRQIDIYQQLPAAARFRQGCSISDTARKVVAYRIRQENPDLTPQEANQMALQRAYTP
jgi:hypothetical protein